MFVASHLKTFDYLSLKVNPLIDSYLLLKRFHGFIARIRKWYCFGKLWNFEFALKFKCNSANFPEKSDIRFPLTYPPSYIRFYPIFVNLPTHPTIGYHMWMSPKTENTFSPTLPEKLFFMKETEQFSHYEELSLKGLKSFRFNCDNLAIEIHLGAVHIWYPMVGWVGRFTKIGENRI